MSNLGECRYCGQPIGTAQLKRIEEAEQEQASQLKRSLQAELQNTTADLQEHVNEATRQKDDAEQRLEDLETALPARIGEEVATATEQLAAELQTTKQKAADFEQHLQESVEAAEKKVRQEAETGFYKDLHEKDKKLQAALTTIEGLQKKLESKPAHELGSFQEDDLVRVLQVEFPRDKIGRNPKSSGADVMHEVFQDGENCGLIVYESKNAANWSSGWVPKLKADALIHNATARILVSTSFPAKSEDFTFVDGVPVLHPRFVVDFVKVIRNSLVEIKQQALSQRDGGYKLEQLMNYLQSPDFRNRMQNIIGSVKKLEDLQQKEQKAHDKTWKEQALLFRGINTSNSDVEQEIKAIMLGH